MPKLSQSYVKSLQPATKDTWHWDDTAKGFAVRQRPGAEPQWWVRYSVNRRKRKHLIGPCSVVKAEAARERAREILELARIGKDHNQMLRDERQQGTITDLSRFHLDLQQPPKVSAGYYRDKKAHWNRYILPALGSVRVVELTRLQIEKFHRKFVNQPALGNSLLATLSKAIVDSGWRPDNPCARVARYKVPPRQRILSIAEIEKLTNRLHELQATSINSAYWLFEMLLITGLRVGELAPRKWTEVNLDLGHLVIPKPKSKSEPRIVILSDRALSVLKSMPKKTQWVFPNTLQSNHIVSPQHFWDDLRKELGFNDVRIHDIRHTVASYAHNVGGLSQREVALLLGHTQLKSTERYLNIHDERLKDISDRAAQAIGGASQPRP